MWLILIDQHITYNGFQFEIPIVLDNGIMIFNASSSNGGELSFLNNTVAVYKDILDLRRGNLTSMGMEVEQSPFLFNRSAIPQ